jgi:hypothetical protein
MEVADIPDHYVDTVGAMNSVRDSDAITAGDPARAAEILVRMARRTDLPYHLPLGVNAVEGSIRQDEFLLAEDRKWATVGRSADFAEPYPVDFPPEAFQMCRRRTMTESTSELRAPEWIRTPNLLRHRLRCQQAQYEFTCGVGGGVGQRDCRHRCRQNGRQPRIHSASR